MRGKRKYEGWWTLGISCLFAILPCAGYGASLTIGDTVSVNGSMNATSFSGDGSGLTNVWGNSTCTQIPSLPYPIAASGVYCLKSNLATAMTTGNAVEIQADDVVIDLNGYVLDGQAAGTGTQAYGIYAFQRKNITIRNGTVRGFFYGIRLGDTSPFTTSQGHIIEDIRADMNTAFGIVVYGRGNIIRNSLVVDTGGSPTEDKFGIWVRGPGNRVINNDVYETKVESGSMGYGIRTDNAPGVVIAGNRVGNAGLQPGISNGVAIVSSNNAMVKDNTISAMTEGIVYALPSTGIYMNNLVSGCTSPFSGGTAAGSTNYSIP